MICDNASPIRDTGERESRNISTFWFLQCLQSKVKKLSNYYCGRSIRIDQTILENANQPRALSRNHNAAILYRWTQPNCGTYTYINRESVITNVYVALITRAHHARNSTRWNQDKRAKFRRVECILSRASLVNALSKAFPSVWEAIDAASEKNLRTAHLLVSSLKRK